MVYKLFVCRPSFTVTLDAGPTIEVLKPTVLWMVQTRLTDMWPSQHSL
jgi:hypothetical protein